MVAEGMKRMVHIQYLTNTTPLLLLPRRLLAALARREWGAAEVLRCTPLLERLGDAASEAREAQAWRYAAVQVLPSCPAGLTSLALSSCSLHVTAALRHACMYGRLNVSSCLCGSALRRRHCTRL